MSGDEKKADVAPEVEAEVVGRADRRHEPLDGLGLDPAARPPACSWCVLPVVPSGEQSVFRSLRGHGPPERDESPVCLRHAR